MAGGDADARAAAQIPHGPAQSGGGFQPGIDVGGDAVGGDDPGGFHGEQIAFDPAVVADGDGLGQIGAFQVVAQALGCPADDVDVHPVGAHADDPPQAAGAEFQIPVEPVKDFLIICQNGQLGSQIRVVQCFLFPERETGHCIHGIASFCFLV